VRVRRAVVLAVVTASFAGNAYVLANVAARWAVEAAGLFQVDPPSPAERMAAAVGTADARVLLDTWPAWAELFAGRRGAWDRARADVLRELAEGSPDTPRVRAAFATMREAEASMESVVHDFLAAVAPSLSAEGRARISGLRPPRR
jgi:hypothetical protein